MFYVSQRSKPPSPIQVVSVITQYYVSLTQVK